jgi:hypothetical protein
LDLEEQHAHGRLPNDELHGFAWQRGAGVISNDASTVSRPKLGQCAGGASSFAEGRHAAESRNFMPSRHASAAVAEFRERWRLGRTV